VVSGRGHGCRDSGRLEGLDLFPSSAHVESVGVCAVNYCVGVVLHTAFTTAKYSSERQQRQVGVIANILTSQGLVLAV